MISIPISIISIINEIRRTERKVAKCFTPLQEATVLHVTSGLFNIKAGFFKDTSPTLEMGDNE